jgi:hypothetical protein
MVLNQEFKDRYWNNESYKELFVQDYRQLRDESAFLLKVKSIICQLRNEREEFLEYTIELLEIQRQIKELKENIEGSVGDETATKASIAEMAALQEKKRHYEAVLEENMAIYLQMVIDNMEEVIEDSNCEWSLAQGATYEIDL